MREDCRRSGRAVVVALGLTVAMPAALAIDPGTAQGWFAVGERSVALTHAQVLDCGRGSFRVLLADREVPLALLEDLAALEGMAHEGGLRGVLLIVSAVTQPRISRLTVLMATDAATPRSFDLRGGSYGGIVAWKAAGNRVRGEARSASRNDNQGFGFAARFDTPHFQSGRCKALGSARP